MSLGWVEINYYLSMRDGPKKLVRGVQIGRFAVRRVSSDDIRGAGLPPPDMAEWVVDHTPTGVGVGAFESFEDAYSVADDISRFSKSDPATPTYARLSTQLGVQIIEWLIAMLKPWTDNNEIPKYIPYREWLAQQGKTWKPRRRKMKMFQ